MLPRRFISGNLYQDSARESLADLLRGEGYEVHEAADGNSAIALIDQHDVDVVLTDLMMPGSDGMAVLRHVRDVSPQTLVILMTAHASVETAIEAIHLGAQDYLLKPPIFEDVLRKGAASNDSPEAGLGEPAVAPGS